MHIFIEPRRYATKPVLLASARDYYFPNIDGILMTRVARAGYIAQVIGTRYRDVMSISSRTASR